MISRLRISWETTYKKQLLSLFLLLEMLQSRFIFPSLSRFAIVSQCQETRGASRAGGQVGAEVGLEVGAPFFELLNFLFVLVALLLNMPISIVYVHQMQPLQLLPQVQPPQLSPPPMCNLSDCSGVTTDTNSFTLDLEDLPRDHRGVKLLNSLKIFAFVVSGDRNDCNPSSVSGDACLRATAAAGILLISMRGQ